MAKNQIIFEIDVKTGQLTKATQNIKKNTKSIEEQEKTQKKATKTSNNYDKQNKSLYQSNLSSAKSFSKMNQTIGGSGGSGALVASYAVLAANVFAVTAAFNTLRAAAASEKLAEGLVAFSNSSGQSLDLVAKKLQETTGHAVSFDMAMRTAALSTSAGFGVAEMEGLTRVAKGASLALGRDMGDALDRLTRGAIKLEPEILDELGIMVRLDDATENYAATLGKSATQLTRFERQQAFMNAIITEGETKFGAIADSIDPNSYDQLSAAFADLSKVVLNLLNSALIPLINFMISSPIIFLGAVLKFSGGIASRILPALGDMSKASLDMAKNAAKASESILEGNVKQMAGAKAQIGRIGEQETAYNKLVDGFQDGTNTMEENKTMMRSLNGSIGSLTAKQKRLEKQGKSLNATDADRLVLMKVTRTNLQTLTGTNVANIATQQTQLALSNALVVAKTEEARIIAFASTQTLTYGDAYTKLKTVIYDSFIATKVYISSIYEATFAQGVSMFSVKGLSASLNILKAAFFGAALGAKGLGAALLTMTGFIGIIVMVAGIAIAVIKRLLKFFGIGTEEAKAYKKASEDLAVVLDGIPDKMKELAKQQERAGHTTQLMINRYKVLGGLLKTVVDQAIEAEKKAVDAGNYGRNGDMQIGRGAFSSEMAASTDAELLGVLGANASPMIKSVRELAKESKDFQQFAETKLGSSLDEFIKNMHLGGNSVQDIAQAMKNLLLDGEVALNGVAQAAGGLSTNFSEAEKEAQKFFRGMVKSTKFDGISSQFKALSNNLEAVVKEAKEAGESPLSFIGEAALKMGKGIGALMGPEVVKAMKDAQKISAEIQAEQMKLSKATGKTEREEIAKNIKLLEKDYKKANTEVGKVVQQNLNITNATLDNLIARTQVTEKEVKFLEERKKSMMAFAKNEFTILAAKKIDDAMARKRLELLKTEVKTKEGAVERALIMQKEGQVLDDDARDALSDQKRLQTEILTLQNSMTESAVNTAEAHLAGLLHQQKMLKAQKELAGVLMSNEEKFAKLFLLSSGNQTGKIKIANVEMTNAQKTYNLAVLEFNMKVTVLNAEHALLRAKGEHQKSQNNLRLSELKDLAKQQKIDDARINELNEKGPEVKDFGAMAMATASSNATGYKGEPIYAGRSAEEEVELAGLLAKKRGDFSEEITALEAYNGAIGKTAATQLELLKITQESTAQLIIGAALDAELKIKDALGNLGEGFLQSGGGTGMLEAMKTALAPSMLSQAADDLQAKLETLGVGKVDEDGKMSFTAKAGLSEEDQAQFDNWEKAYNDLVERTKGKNFELANSFSNMATAISSMFGEDGAVVAGLMNLSATMLTSFDNMTEGFDKLKEKGDEATKQDKLDAYAGALEGVGNILGSLGQLAAASAKQKIAGVDQEIAAEKKRDGKSKESLAKIAALEKKKEMIERKAFERNKKIQMAQIIVNTAAAIMKASPNLPMMVLMGVMGAAQLAMVAGTSYQGGGSIDQAAAPSSISVGKRDNKVDVSRGASAGETAFLRGGTGVGTNANNFRSGAAAGMKSYSAGGEILVGERGPEVITPLSPLEVTPNDKIGGMSNVNFTINAVDAAGVEQLLVAQKGNIIGMIREAANEHGEEFMEGVNTNAYGGEAI